MTPCERIREAREARAWAQRVDSETLAAGLAIPDRTSAYYRAACTEWNARFGRAS